MLYHWSHGMNKGRFGQAGADGAAFLYLKGLEEN
jgi:hypothetical protein